ncbi:MAG: PaaI family thioesterase [Kofleriaceae bacterium]|nr:PaaI family thioesterase [Kofleriaceae bacterium]
MNIALQDRYAPHGRCFGCGPTNTQGLRIKSFRQDDGHVVCAFTPAPHHEAFENVLNGGIIGTVLDCHMNWTTISHLIVQGNLAEAPPCVTAEFKVVLKRPTPLVPVHVDAHVVSASEDRATIAATMTADGKVTAIGSGTFIAVKPGHPAYHRW